MNKKINEDLKAAKFIFERNKLYILPAVVISICIILFFQFMIPQFKALFEAREQARNAALNLISLKEKLNVLTNVNEESLDSQLEILNKALPLNKDFGGILNSIYFASQKAGVSLGAFSLQIGDLFEEKSKDKFPMISISLPVNSGSDGVNSFVQTITRTVPLSEVSNIKVEERNSVIKVSFYYKPLGFSGENQDVHVSPISQKGLSLIKELRDFENVSLSTAESAIPL